MFPSGQENKSHIPLLPVEQLILVFSQNGRRNSSLRRTCVAFSRTRSSSLLGCCGQWKHQFLFYECCWITSWTPVGLHVNQLTFSPNKCWLTEKSEFVCWKCELGKSKLAEAWVKNCSIHWEFSVSLRWVQLDDKTLWRRLKKKNCRLRAPKNNACKKCAFLSWVWLVTLHVYP